MGTQIMTQGFSILLMASFMRNAMHEAREGDFMHITIANQEEARRGRGEKSGWCEVFFISHEYMLYNHLMAFTDYGRTLHWRWCRHRR